MLTEGFLHHNRLMQVKRNPSAALGSTSPSQGRPYGIPQTGHEPRTLISPGDGRGGTGFRRWDSAGPRLPNTVSLRRGCR